MSKRSPQELLDWLQARLKKPLRLRVNNNRSTMVSMRAGYPYTHVSLHRMFLAAPERVLNDIVKYVRSPRSKLGVHANSYINEQLPQFNYEHRVDESQLEQEGTVYDLKEIYDKINAQYFNNELKLRITWWGERRRRARRSITFGQYHDPLKLVKIHRMMDCASFPRYFVEFVVYHEMLHSVARPYVDGDNVNRIHNQEFKDLERAFQEYELAQAWLAEHRDRLFQHSA